MEKLQSNNAKKRHDTMRARCEGAGRVMLVSKGETP